MQNILIFFQAYLFGRLGSRALGLMLLLSLIWWAGPYVGLHEQSIRLYLIAGTLALFFGIWLVRAFIVRKRSNQFKQALDSQGGQDQSRQLEIEELRTKMNAAISSLKSSELGTHHRGNAALYALPWFMIIGPAAAGKTTLLRNSGLSFPYAHDNDIDIRGFGGTRNCDWWFSNEAVLLDTAGRYTTEQDDHEEWLAFLGMLKKHRRRQPLTGAIVAISLSDLLTADSQEIERHVKIIRDRIEELSSRLGCIFPIYIVFTKCDLLYGFNSYFADLDEKEREQVWGAWMGHDKEGDFATTFCQKLESMYHRLCEMRIHKLSMVRKMEAKGELFDFPAQFDAAKDHLVEFISKLTNENPYQDTPNFCGIYLTSATQEGTPLQKILGNMRQAFGYVDESNETDRTEPKSYFVKNFFKGVVFPNSHDVSRTRKLGVIHRALKTASILASVGIMAGCFLLLSTTLTINTLLLKKGTDAAQLLEKEAQAKENGLYHDFLALSQVLTQYQTLMNNEKHLPLSLTLGVYEGDKQLPAIRSLLLTSFERAFYKPALMSLESRLINYSKVWATANLKRQDEIRDPFYKELKSYLMLSQPKRLETDYVVPVLQQIIQERLAGHLDGKELSESDNQHLSDLLQVYLSRLLVNKEDPDYVAPYQPDNALISNIQNQLKAMPDSGRLYAQILNKGKLKSPPIPLKDMINGPGRGILTSDYKQPFMFTYDGWQNYVQPEIKNLVHAACRGDWVTGYLQDSDPSPDARGNHTSASDEYARQLETDIRALYFADYVDSWLNLINQVQLNTFSSLDDAAKRMLMIARNDGPFAELLQVVSKNINITQHGGLAVVEGTSIKTASLIPELDAPLHDLRKLTDPGDKMTISLPINQYLLALTSAQSEMEQMAAAVEVQQESFRYASAILGGTGTTDSELYKCWLSTNSLLNGMDARTRKVAEHLLYEPIQKAWMAIIQQTQDYLQNQWTNSVLVQYQRKISEKFPFAANGNDASLRDVSDFFRPGDGVIWVFTDDQLKPFLRKKRNGWTEKSWLGTGLNFDRSLLNSLAQASLISSGMFQHGESQPDVLFSIFPIPSKGLRVVHFESNGQKLIYQNEPQEWKPFRWPGDKQIFAAQIGAIPSGNHSMITRKYSGDWSLFHLLHDASYSDQGMQYTLSWELKNDQELPLTVQLTLRPDRRNNIFAKGLFSKFRLPSQIF